MVASRNRRNGPPAKELATLWGKSAGRCNICNTNLFIDATTGVEVKAGEVAHIVGLSDGPRAPRGQSSLSKKERDRAENLILLCEKHHTEIDARVDLYSVEYLTELKRKFEERIRFLGSLTEDNKTLILRMVGTIHGNKVPDIQRETVRETVRREEGRYPRFDLSSTDQDASIDLRDLVDEGSTAYWKQVEGQIERRMQQIALMQSDGRGGHLSIFGLARIPALVMLGHHLGDASDVTIYHRRNDGGWGWDADAALPRFELVKHGDGAGDGDDVTLACSLTAAVRLDRAPKPVQASTIFEIRPVGRQPGHTLLDHPKALAVFTKAYREFLSELEPLNPAAINVLPAVPADAAIAVGRIRTPAVSPALRLYDLNKETRTYELAVEIAR